MDHGPIEEQPEDERPRSPRPQGPDIEDPQSKASKAMTAVYAAGQDARDQKREAANADGVEAGFSFLSEKLKTPDGRAQLGNLAAHETAAENKNTNYFLANYLTNSGTLWRGDGRSTERNRVGSSLRWANSVYRKA